VKFFFDANIPPRFVRALRVLVEPQGHDLVHLHDRFEPSTKDADWIRALAQEGNWVVISGDIRIRKTPANRKAWKEAQLTTVFLGSGWTKLKIFNQAAELISAWPTIIMTVRDAAPGTGFEIPLRSKRLKVVYSSGS
jgi:hypothetical protein